MFTINDGFLVDVGLGAMPAPDRAEFLRLVYETLEERVGRALSDGLSDPQLDEFSAIIDRDPERVTTWIDDNAPDFPNDPIYSRMQEALDGREDPTGIVCEYAATKWLEVNRPDYRDVVAGELETLKAELIARVPQILSACRESA